MAMSYSISIISVIEMGREIVKKTSGRDKVNIRKKREFFSNYFSGWSPNRRSLLPLINQIVIVGNEIQAHRLRILIKYVPTCACREMYSRSGKL